MASFSDFLFYIFLIFKVSSELEDKSFAPTSDKLCDQRTSNILWSDYVLTYETRELGKSIPLKL